MKNKLVTEEVITTNVKRFEKSMNESIKSILGHDKVMIKYTYFYDSDSIEGRLIDDTYDSDFFVVARLEKFRNSFGGHQTKMYLCDEDEMFQTLDLDSLSEHIARKFLADATVSNVFVRMLAEKVGIFDEDKILHEWNETRLVRLLTGNMFKNNIIELISCKASAEVSDNPNLGKVVIADYLSGGMAKVDAGMEVHSLYMKIIDILVPYLFLLAKEEDEDVY